LHDEVKIYFYSEVSLTDVYEAF